MHASSMRHEAVHEWGVSIKTLGPWGDRLHLVLPIFADYFSTTGPVLAEGLGPCP